MPWVKSLSKSHINKPVYESNAKEFDEQRSKQLFERTWLDKFTSLLEKNSHILDVGCGSGEPIAKYLIELGMRIVGVDYSKGMIELAKKRYPEHNWIVGDMCELNLSEKFDALISWNAFFHLTHEEQRKVIPLFAKSLRPNGLLMLTIGHDEGEVYGAVNGKSVYHSSLSIEEYQNILVKYNIEIIEFKLNDPTCQGHSILLAKLKA